MDSDLAFDPAEVYEEISSTLERLDLSGSWKIKSIKEGDIIKQREDTDKQMIFCSEALIEKSPEEIAEAIIDPSIRKNWDKYFQNAESLLNWGKNLKLVYFHQKYKRPLRDRDFVLVQGISKETEKKIIIGWKSVDFNKKLPIPGIVRGTIVFSGFVITKVKENTSQVTYIEKSCPHMHLPAFLVNSLQKKSLEIVADLKRFFSGKYYAYI